MATIDNALDSIVNNPLSDLTVNVNAASNTVNLSNFFSDALSSGQVAHFTLANTSIGTIGNGVVNVVLFDKTTTGAPLTVNNFDSYVNNGSYTNTIIHRSIASFIIQGGGFTYNNSTLGTITSNAPVQNEYSAQRSNVRGTIAMAKAGSDPNSATNQWFFSLADNSTNLNNQNGGFTAFGQVASTDDLATIDAIAAVPNYNANSTTNPTGPFTNLPLTQPTISDNNFIRFSSITVTQEKSLTFSIVGNTNPSLVTPTINNNQLLLSYLPNQTGQTDITVRATNLFNQTFDDKFTIFVQQPINSPNTNDPVYRFYNPASQEHFYTATPSERDFLKNTPSIGYNFEGVAFKASLTNASDLIPVYRFYDKTTTDHFFTSNVSEETSLKNNPSSGYNFEGIAFYAVGASSNLNTPVYRFFNSSNGQHLFTGNITEITGLSSSWVSEGVAFKAAF